MKRILSLIFALCLAASGHADTSVGPDTYSSQSLKRGSTTVATINPWSTDGCHLAGQTDATTRAASATYVCGPITFAVTYTAPPIVCPGTPPADTSKMISCSAPYFGTRQVTQGWTLQPTPTCWVNDGPISPPADTVPPCTTSPPSGSYTTTFPATENPLSEGGAWQHLASSWSTVATIPGLAYGTQVNRSSNPFNDSYAHLTGFSANQSIEGTIFISNPDIVDQEVELLLRVTDTTSSVKAYEINYGFTGRYAQVMKWLGPIGQFQELLTVHNVAAPKTGDKLKATIVGNVITVYMNGAQIMQVTDPSAFPSGQPGIGMFIDTGGATLKKYGFSSITATQLP